MRNVNNREETKRKKLKIAVHLLGGTAMPEHRSTATPPFVPIDMSVLMRNSNFKMENLIFLKLLMTILNCSILRIYFVQNIRNPQTASTILLSPTPTTWHWILSPSLPCKLLSLSLITLLLPLTIPRLVPTSIITNKM